MRIQFSPLTNVGLWLQYACKPIKGISLIGRATVLHTEGQVFESPIP